MDMIKVLLADDESRMRKLVKDFLSKKVRKNKGELQQFYVSGGHEAIVEPELFDRVQEILAEQEKVDIKAADTTNGAYPV